VITWGCRDKLCVSIPFSFPPSFPDGRGFGSARREQYADVAQSVEQDSRVVVVICGFKPHRLHHSHKRARKREKLSMHKLVHQRRTVNPQKQCMADEKAQRGVMPEAG
jgi:uncharacterized protein (DUF934 family)